MESSEKIRKTMFRFAELLVEKSVLQGVKLQLRNFEHQFSERIPCCILSQKYLSFSSFRAEEIASNISIELIA